MWCWPTTGRLEVAHEGHEVWQIYNVDKQELGLSDGGEAELMMMPCRGELLLELYRLHGPRFVRRLDGDFALLARSLGCVDPAPLTSPQRLARP